MTQCVKVILPKNDIFLKDYQYLNFRINNSQFFNFWRENIDATYYKKAKSLAFKNKLPEGNNFDS